MKLSSHFKVFSLKKFKKIKIPWCQTNFELSFGESDSVKGTIFLDAMLDIMLEQNIKIKY